MIRPKVRHLPAKSSIACDQVVAPVRETCAQALGAAARGLPINCICMLAGHLGTLVARPEWEVRLGGLLGIKYLLAARLDTVETLLHAVLPCVLLGLQVKRPISSKNKKTSNTQIPVVCSPSTVKYSMW